MRVMSTFRVAFIPEGPSKRGAATVVADGWSATNEGGLVFTKRVQGNDFKIVRQFSPNSRWSDVTEMEELATCPSCKCVVDVE